MQQIKNDKQKRNLMLRLNDVLKTIEKYTNQLLKTFVEQLDNEQLDNNNKFIQQFGNGIVDMFGMDCQHCFITPNKMSALWNIVLDWCSKSKPKNYTKHDNDWEFDFIENRIWLLKYICNYNENIKYIILLYDSKKTEAKGFIKHLGVGIKTSIQRNRIEGVRINAHPHGLLYGRRPFESIICDLCDADWNGSSWHCKNGCDFDTCHNCFVKYLEHKQLYRSILYLRGKYDNIKLVKKKHKITLFSELFYDDIRKLQLQSSILLSAIHQYLFYSYSCYIHPRIMDLMQIILEVINPLQVQSLSKDIQLALFQLFDPDDILYKLPKYIEISLRFPQYVQLSFWTLLNSYLRTRNNNNCDELYIQCIKHLSTLKKSYIFNIDNTCIWITATAMNGFLDWTQIIHKSKKIDEIYDALLSFPIKNKNRSNNNKNKNKNRNKSKNKNKNKTKVNDMDIDMNDNDQFNTICCDKQEDEIRSMSPSTTVFNISDSSFDEFHIQCLVQLLSLKSPKWKTWLTQKLKYLRNKYQQKQAQFEHDNEFISLNKARKRRSNINNINDEIENAFQCDINIEYFDEGYLLNLLKFYEYLTFVEPNIKENSVSIMANTFLYDADQRNLLVKFFNQFTSLNHFLNELTDFWPPESSKSLSPKKVRNNLNNINNMNNTSNNINVNSNHSFNSFTNTNLPKRKREKRKTFMSENNTNSESDEDYNEKDDINDRESSEMSEDNNDNTQSLVKYKSKTISKKSHLISKKISNKISNNSDSSHSSHSSIGKKNKNTNKKSLRKYRRNHNIHNDIDGKIPKRRPITQTNSNKRTRDNNNINTLSLPPNKKRKISQNNNESNNGPPPITNLRRSQSNNVNINKKYNNNSNSNNNSPLKRSPNRKRKRQIHDDSSDDDANNNNKNNNKNKNNNQSHPLFLKQKQRQKHMSKSPRSPTRSESSVSYEYDDDDDEEEDSLAKKYSQRSPARKHTNNNDDDTNESWFS